MTGKYFNFKNSFVQGIVFLILSLYLLFPMYMFQHMTHMSHMHSMPLQNCPYMTGESAVCPIDFFGHLSVWQNMSRGLITLKVTLATLFFIVFLGALSFLSTLREFFLDRKKQQFQTIPLLYQTLFSQGILNSKAF